MSSIDIKTGEGKWVRFTITQDGAIVNCSAATFTFGLKKQWNDTEYIIEKTDTDFDKSEAANGIVSINITATESSSLDLGTHVGELKIIFTADEDVDKSEIFNVNVKRSVIHD